MPYRHQHHLEPDEEVEQIARQNRARCSEQEELEEGVVVDTLVLLVDKLAGEDDRIDGDDRRYPEHERRQLVGDEDEREVRSVVLLVARHTLVSKVVTQFAEEGDFTLTDAKASPSTEETAS